MTGVRPNSLPDQPQLKVDIDQSKATALGLSIADVNTTLGTAWGSSYVNDFVDRGRVKHVYVQGDAPYRSKPEDLDDWYVRGATGTLAPFSAFSSTHWVNGPSQLGRYNGVPALEIQGQPAEGVSSGAALTKIEAMVKKLPPGVGMEWTGLSYEESGAGSQTPMLFSLSFIVVFLALAALYESWSVPIAVLLVVPLGIVGAVLAVTVRGLSNDVFFQVGLLTTMGLAAKNAILIVEFAEAAVKDGKTPIEAAIEAGRLRLRPILMTSLAFVVGVLPLALSNGAGSGGQNDIGTGVVGGMIAATVLAIFFVPLFYVLVRRVSPPKARKAPADRIADAQRAGRLRCAAPLPALRLVAALVAGGLLGGCIDMAPKYSRPALPVDAALPSGGAYASAEPVQVAAPDLPWRDFFTDSKLQAVIQLALDHNRDLRVAVLNIAEARAQYRIQRSALFPHIDAAGEGTLEHLPASVLGAESGVTSTTAGGAGKAANSNQSIYVHYYEASLGVTNYELDLWGRVRSLTRQAMEQYLSTEAAQRATRISLISQVATDYVTYAADLERLNVAKATVKSDEESLRVTQARFYGGIASELDVRQAESALGQAQAGVSTYTTTVAQDIDGLTLLVGAKIPPDLVPGPLGENRVTLADLPAGLSSEVLLRRPDVDEAEHTLKAQNADIGAARAAFFPTVELTGSGGTTSLSLGNLFAPGTGAWSFTPAITLPIFDAGQNAANLRSAKVERDIALAQYEEAVQTAFREVADALAQRGQIAGLVAANERETLAVDRSLTLSQARYRRGSDTYLNVLNAQVTSYTAQLNLAGARLTRAANLITLYQVLGGGVR